MLQKFQYLSNLRETQRYIGNRKWRILTYKTHLFVIKEGELGQKLAFDPVPLLPSLVKP